MDGRRKRFREAAPTLRRWGLGLVAALAGGSLLLVLPFRWINPPTSSVILQERIGAVLKKDQKPPEVGRWTDWEAIASDLALAVIAAEDQKFPEHRGFDLDAIADAIEERMEGGRLRGASTISQQVAKNLYLWHGQTLVRKGFEAYFTVLIEALWPKRRILEIYLNIAEFGNGVYGVGRASRRYFGKSPERLTRRECCRLAAVLPSPKRMDPSRPSAYVRSRAAWIERQIGLMGGKEMLRRLDR